MHFTTDQVIDGVREQDFVLGEVPGVLWSPPETTSPRPLIVLGHGGGQHKRAPGIVARARLFATELGFHAVCADVPGHGERPLHPEFDRLASQNQERVEAGEARAEVIAGFQALVAEHTVPEWRSMVDALEHVLGQGPVGYWGVSLGCGLGVPFVAAEPRVQAAVLGLGSAVASADLVKQITVPVQFLAQWDDEFISREQSLALFEALGSQEKTLHANPGGHGDLPRHEMQENAAFFRRHLQA